MSSFLCLCAVYIAQTSIESLAYPLIRATLLDREESIIQFYTYSSKRLGGGVISSTSWKTSEDSVDLPVIISSKMTPK